MAESSTATREPPVSTTPVPILYVNWRGETSVRRIVPGPTWFGSTEWHPEPQWLMTADEPDTGKRRDFALAGIKAWGDAAVDVSAPSTRAENVSSGSAYSAVFALIRESLEVGAPGLASGIKDAIARSGALKLGARKLAPPAYGDKRQPYHSGACIGIDGMSVNLRFSDNSAELVFGEEDLELINEEGRDLYIARLLASEILALRQALIDYLPAAEETADRASPIGTFQSRVQPWMMACFGEMIAGDREERNHRFLEEALELVQACGCTADEARQLVDYVFGRPVGEKGQEVGGVMVTLSALCLAQDLDLHREAETELARIWTKVEQIRAKQASKPKHSPLPERVGATGRCEICNWPLAESRERGCVPGDCSYRPEDPAEQRRIADRRTAFAATGPKTAPTFRAGDIVLHKPSNETWTVAYADPVSNNIAWCGWPDGIARLSDCELVSPATDEQHRGTLREVIKAGGTRAAAAQRLYGDPDAVEVSA